MGSGRTGRECWLGPTKKKELGCDTAGEARGPGAYGVPSPGAPARDINDTAAALYPHDFSQNLPGLYRGIAGPQGIAPRGQDQGLALPTLYANDAMSQETSGRAA